MEQYLSDYDLKDLHHCVGSLYLDPCLGRVTGMSLLRFLIRGFPDPVTESSFWKIVNN